MQEQARCTGAVTMVHGVITSYNSTRSWSWPGYIIGSNFQITSSENVLKQLSLILKSLFNVHYIRKSINYGFLMISSYVGMQTYRICYRTSNTVRIWLSDKGLLINGYLTIKYLADLSLEDSIY